MDRIAVKQEGKFFTCARCHLKSTDEDLFAVVEVPNMHEDDIGELPNAKDWVCFVCFNTDSMPRVRVIKFPKKTSFDKPAEMPMKPVPKPIRRGGGLF